MIEIGDYEVPARYVDARKERAATREKAAVYDSSHGAKFQVTGPNAEKDIDKLITQNVSTIVVGTCSQALMCNEQGGIIDHITVYHPSESSVLIVGNTVNHDYDDAWIRAHLSSDSVFSDVSEEMVKIDLQGPHTPGIMEKLFQQSLNGFRYRGVRSMSFENGTCIVARHGITGEIGFEMFCDNPLGVQLWRRCIQQGIEPAGVLALDGLRLEMGFPAFGQEMNSFQNAGELGMEWLIDPGATFIGAELVHDPAQFRAQLVAVVVEPKRQIRTGDRIINTYGVDIGTLSSVIKSPYVDGTIALGYVTATAGSMKAGTNIVVRSGSVDVRAKIVETPFYKNGTFDKPIEQFLGRGE